MADADGLDPAAWQPDLSMDPFDDDDDDLYGTGAAAVEFDDGAATPRYTDA